ncbi:uncharacterized protein [Rutidosis leptorrhynchoides]|uniref:uncharacterized protein n=1 Tax=Rutidosis leptorrhynchoides TaxID=125765 RepID=UPI003A994F84
MKNLADKRRTDRIFDIGAWVYVKLQPHKKVTLRAHKYSKLYPKFYGPYQIISRIGALKEHKGAPPAVMGPIPPIDGDGTLHAHPIKLLERKMVKKDNHVAIYGLIQWQNGSIEDATWELLEDLYIRFLEFEAVLAKS